MKHQLDFEKPIVELQNKLDALKKQPENHSLGVGFGEEQTDRKEDRGNPETDFSNLTAWQRVQAGPPPQTSIHTRLSDFHVH
jgi:acetyl-CoA carboxylase alpha subunit